jgi:hypothetical protein
VSTRISYQRSLSGWVVMQAWIENVIFDALFMMHYY